MDCPTYEMGAAGHAAGQAGGTGGPKVKPVGGRTGRRTGKRAGWQTGGQSVFRWAGVKVHLWVGGQAGEAGEQVG